MNGEQEGPLLLKDEPIILNDGDLPLLGSWTFFKKLVSHVKYEAVIQEYLPVDSHIPDYPTCK